MVANATAQSEPRRSPQQPGQTAGPIRWIDDPVQAIAIARQSGRPIVAYVTSANCGYCRKMERETWSQTEIMRRVAEDWVPLRLSADRHPEEVAALRVRAYPTTVLLSPEGAGYAGAAGFLAPDKLTQLLRPRQSAAPLAARSVSR